MKLPRRPPLIRVNAIRSLLEKGMEDIRKLIYDYDAAIDLESLAYTVCGLTDVLTELLRDGPPTEPGEQVRC